MENNNSFIMKPKVDFCFKELMASAAIRQGFIAAVLGIPPEEILQTELLPAHLRQKYAEDKLGILDVRVILNKTVQIDMEIQVAQYMFWPERSLFYLSKIYIEQIHKGSDYDILKKCIHVGILDFILFEEDDEYYSRFHLWEDKRRRMYSDKFEIYIVELPKAADGEYPDTPLLKWAKFIRAEKKEEFEMIAKTDPYIEKAYEELLYISADEEKRLEYEARQKAILDYNSVMRSNWESGREEGLKEGELKLIRQVCKKIQKGIPAEETADMLEEEEGIIQEIYDIAEEFAPDYNPEKILQRLKMKKRKTPASSFSFQGKER